MVGQVSDLQLQAGRTSIIQNKTPSDTGWRFFVCHIWHHIPACVVWHSGERSEPEHGWAGRRPASSQKKAGRRAINVDPWLGCKWLLLSSGTGNLIRVQTFPGQRCIACISSTLRTYTQINQLITRRYLMYNEASHTGGMESN